MSVAPVHHRFKVDEYEQMVDHGILNENDRVELIRGEIVEKMAIGNPHAACVNRLTREFVRQAGDLAIVAVQNPIRLSDSMPEPDLALLRPRDDFYASGAPEAADAFLVVEVSETSLDYDREVKRPIYAESGVREYWIVNLTEETLEVHRQPRPEGRYGEVLSLRADEEVTVEALPGVSFKVSDVLPNPQGKPA